MHLPFAETVADEFGTIFKNTFSLTLKMASNGMPALIGNKQTHIRIDLV